jgi:eukaryotic-like serine/threonine-protein kinase
MEAARKQQPRRTAIGPYQLLAKIGEGGMGTVHLTKMDGPAGFNKLAVVKELRPDLLGNAPFLEMFLNEARIAARLAHPNVVHTYGADEDDGRLYLAMEYLDGQPWSRVRHVLWQRGTLPHDLHVKVIAQVLSGLHYAHELRDYDGKALQVVHCDMSPQNVFVTYDGQVKIVDFGVARAVTVTERPDADMIVGKLAYIAPEQARGEEVDRRADIFAVGVMLWEALAGKRYAEDKDLKELRRKRSMGEGPRLRDAVPDVPQALSDICDRALALDPKDRYATAAEFREALLACLTEDYQDADRERLGQLVSQVFAKERAKVHAVIERHLKQSSSLASSIEDLVASLHPEPAEHTIKADLSELASVSRLRDEAAMVEASNSASIHFERKKGPMAVVGVAAAVLLLGAWAIAGESKHGTARPAGATTTAAAKLPAMAGTQLQPSAPPRTPGVRVESQPAAAPILAQTVPLVISASPPDAVLYMDGLPLHSNPYAASVRADGEMHLIRATGPGLQTQERVITLDRERVVTFDLGPRAVRLSTRSPSVRKPALTNGAGSYAPIAPPVEAPAPRVTARVRSNDFDADLKLERKPREIYDEDPYR